MKKSARVVSGGRRETNLQGKLRQKEKDGPYYYRLTIANGIRKEFALKTSNLDEAYQKASDLDSVWLAATPEVAMAQINAIKGFSKQAVDLSLSDAWDRYSVHPQRATPRTQSERGAYKSTYQEFVTFITNQNQERKKNYGIIAGVGDITFEVCNAFSTYLKTTELACC